VKTVIRCLCLFVVFTLPGCGEKAVLPEEPPLATPAAVVEQLYGSQSGPLEVIVKRDVKLPGENEHRPLSLNLYYPAAGQAFPLLLFSHGNWSDKDSYDRIIEHWVSHGYAVVAANHLDCCSMPRGIFNAVRYGQLGLIRARMEDLEWLLSKLPTLAELDPGFAGKADVNRLGLTGHSFGAFSAQQFGGAGTFDPESQRYLFFKNPAVKAIVALSPPGPMFDTITADSWGELSTPHLVTTGTWDIQPSFWPDWRMHLMSYETSPAADKYALVTRGADHFLGNLICRLDRDEKPQEDALTMVKIASTAFLDAYLKGEPRARELLRDGSLGDITGGFARLETPLKPPRSAHTQP
jgi:dienelactone hydrolase